MKTAIERDARGAKGSQIFSRILNFVDANAGCEFKSSQACDAAKIGGSKSETKAVHNTLDYLVRECRIQRIERGRYYVPELGVGIVTSDDLGGEPTRYEYD
ncbi:MAG TPA: hypothetical protein VHT03_07950 [Rhizomicrobium sp.]|nr:hypothetical protein [Rhizomicrobium sp.]